MLICIYKQTNSGISGEISFLVVYNGIGDNSGDFCSHSHSDGKEPWSLQSILPPNMTTLEYIDGIYESYMNY